MKCVVGKSAPISLVSAETPGKFSKDFITSCNVANFIIASSYILKISDSDNVSATPAPISAWVSVKNLPIVPGLPSASGPGE